MDDSFCGVIDGWIPERSATLLGRCGIALGAISKTGVLLLSRYSHLSSEEREQIAILQTAGYGVHDIAKALGRHPASMDKPKTAYHSLPWNRMFRRMVKPSVPANPTTRPSVAATAMMMFSLPAVSDWSRLSMASR